MATTTNFGWQTPDDTDLVKDGAAAIRTLGSAIDTSLVDLKGGTTDQVLAKNSNTDMDFKWVTSDDANAIQNAIVDAKGDLIAASAADTPARLAVGNNGDTLLADSAATTGLRWQPDFSVGRNKIINGDFRINQRAFSSTTSNGTFLFDRFQTAIAGDGTATFSAQTFTPGTAPVAGYEGVNYLRIVTASQTSTAVLTALQQRVEDVRTLSGQTVTISFWAKASSGTPDIAVNLNQNFGSGGSPSSSVANPVGKTTISTSWARYSLTYALPSVSGKTFGTSANSRLDVNIWVSAGSDNNTGSSTLGIQNNTFEFWGIQIEAGSVATAFQTATGTLQGELAACQRYYVRLTGDAAYQHYGQGNAYSTTQAAIQVPLPVTMRIAPSSVDYSTLQVGQSGLSGFNVTNVTMYQNSRSLPTVTGTVASGLTSGTFYALFSNNSTSGYVAFNAEL